MFWEKVKAQPLSKTLLKNNWLFKSNFLWSLFNKIHEHLTGIHSIFSDHSCSCVERWLGNAAHKTVRYSHIGNIRFDFVGPIRIPTKSQFAFVGLLYVSISCMQIGLLRLSAKLQHLQESTVRNYCSKLLFSEKSDCVSSTQLWIIDMMHVLYVYERIQDFKRMIVECVIYWYIIVDYNA